MKLLWKFWMRLVNEKMSFGEVVTESLYLQLSRKNRMRNMQILDVIPLIWVKVSTQTRNSLDLNKSLRSGSRVQENIQHSSSLHMHLQKHPKRALAARTLFEVLRFPTQQLFKQSWFFDWDQAVLHTHLKLAWPSRFPSWLFVISSESNLCEEKHIPELHCLVSKHLRSNSKQILSHFGMVPRSRNIHENINDSSVLSKYSDLWAE